MAKTLRDWEMEQMFGKPLGYIHRGLGCMSNIDEKLHKVEYFNSRYNSPTT